MATAYSWSCLCKLWCVEIQHKSYSKPLELQSLEYIPQREEQDEFWWCCSSSHQWDEGRQTLENASNERCWHKQTWWQRCVESGAASTMHATQATSSEEVFQSSTKAWLLRALSFCRWAEAASDRPNISLKQSIYKDTSMTKRQPAYSWPGMLEVVENPFLTLVRGVLRSLCQPKHWFISKRSVLYLLALSLFLPIWMNNESTTFLNQPMGSRWRNSPGLAPKIPRLLCRPNLARSMAFFKYCCKVSFNLQRSWSLTILFTLGVRDR